jgi:NADH dehydrogenase (ubiquinone) Fe-S protein 3
MQNKNTKIEHIVPILTYSPISNEKFLVVSHTHLLFSINCLKLHTSYQYKLLTCISGLDIIESKYRFGLIYDLLSLTYNTRIKIKIFVNEITAVDSIINVYINSNW